MSNFCSFLLVANETMERWSRLVLASKELVIQTPYFTITNFSLAFCHIIAITFQTRSPGPSGKFSRCQFLGLEIGVIWVEVWCLLFGVHTVYPPCSPVDAVDPSCLSVDPCPPVALPHPLDAPPCDQAHEGGQGGCSPTDPDLKGGRGTCPLACSPIGASKPEAGSSSNSSSTPSPSSSHWFRSL